MKIRSPRRRMKIRNPRPYLPAGRSREGLEAERQYWRAIDQEAAARLSGISRTLARADRLDHAYAVAEAILAEPEPPHIPYRFDLWR